MRHSLGMKKAVIYARVSGDQQRKEGTIESQIIELKKQVAEAGHVLVKEYNDDGYSGARLDRPALDQLRKDIKTKLFETIYFLSADRIARDSTYQNIIISEILKNKKQVIINGKDYIHNPENKFTLTVLGAVAELERAKIIERTSRGRQLKLAQGQLSGAGSNTYGYDYINKTPTSQQKFVINKKEAKIVRFIFAEYAKGQVGMNPIARKLEDRKIPTKSGKFVWRKSQLKVMLNNNSYCGTMYFNKFRRVKEYANPIFGINQTSSKITRRDKEDWIGIKVPAIISQGLFDKVQERMTNNRLRYRNPQMPHLLTSLIRCGHCGSSFYGYRRHYTEPRKNGPDYVFERVAYKCNWRLRQEWHSKNAPITRCTSREMKDVFLEAKVFSIIEKVMTDPEKIRKHMAFFKEKGRAAHVKLERRLKNLEMKIQGMRLQKRRVIDVYSVGDLERRDYINKCLRIDNETNLLNKQRLELVRRVPLLHKTEIIDTSIKQYCESIKIRYAQCNDFTSKRQFLVDYVEQITYWNDKIAVHGSIPVLIGKQTDQNYDDTETSKLEFYIES